MLRKKENLFWIRFSSSVQKKKSVKLRIKATQFESLLVSKGKTPSQMKLHTQYRQNQEKFTMWKEEKENIPPKAMTFQPNSVFFFTIN